MVVRSPLPRPSPSFPSLAARDGKLGEGLGTRLGCLVVIARGGAQSPGFDSWRRLAFHHPLFCNVCLLLEKMSGFTQLDAILKLNISATLNCSMHLYENYVCVGKT